MKKYEVIKLGILFFALSSFLLILNNYSKNGRYRMENDKVIIVDTRTGKTYDIYGNLYESDN
jgi:hypothetical protein